MNSILVYFLRRVTQITTLIQAVHPFSTVYKHKVDKISHLLQLGCPYGSFHDSSTLSKTLHLSKMDLATLWKRGFLVLLYVKTTIHRISLQIESATALAFHIDTATLRIAEVAKVFCRNLYTNRTGLRRRFDKQNHKVRDRTIPPGLPRRTDPHFFFATVTPAERIKIAINR